MINGRGLKASCIFHARAMYAGHIMGEEGDMFDFVVREGANHHSWCVPVIFFAPA